MIREVVRPWIGDDDIQIYFDFDDQMKLASITVQEARSYE
jgi:hypothetical protein